MTDEKAPSGRTLPVAVFLLIQAGVALVGAALVYGGRDTLVRRPRLAPAHPTPVVAAPCYDRPEIVGDVELYTVLHKLRPRLAGAAPMVNHLDHALRLWGASADFDDPECLSGVQMRDILLDHRSFAKAWGKEQPPLLIAERGAVGVRTKEGRASCSHVDHTLACLAEAGTTLRYPVRLPQGETTLGALLARSVRTFSLNQAEYEWSVATFAHYVDGTDSWVTSEGQEVNFDRLARRVMREDLRLGVCCGQHRLGNLVLMLRIDEKRRILSPECRRAIIEHLTRAGKLLPGSQHPKGYWTPEWWTGAPPKADDEKVRGGISPQLWRIIATGHILEWLALAPESVHPPAETLAKAGRWLTQTVLEMDDKLVMSDDYYPPLSHVGMALALWRGRLPAQVLADKALREQADGMKSAPDR